MGTLSLRSNLCVLMGILIFVNLASAEESPRVGRDAAAKYFQKRVPVSDDESDTPSRTRQFFNSNEDHYMALHFGKYMQSESWEWDGSGRKNDVGDFSVGVTYRMSEWHNSMDMNIRVDFNQYKIGNKKPLKMSLMPVITFPDATSKFPLYFGFGAGLGVFFKQLEDKSPLSLDYQLLLGARFFNVFENTGFFIESGLKNSLLLTTTGQFNGTFLSGGMVFTF